MVKAVSVFVTAFILDIAWALYIRRTASGKAMASAFFASLLMVLGAYNTMSYVNEPWLIAPIVAGAFIGTYLVVRYEHRGDSK